MSTVSCPDGILGTSIRRDRNMRICEMGQSAGRRHRMARLRSPGSGKLVAGAWEQTIDTVVGIALVILVAISWVAYQSTDRLLETNRLTAETSAVIDALDQVVSDLVDAETGQRGYLLTGDQAYLAPYLTARDEIDADLQTLRTAATQSPERLEGSTTWRRSRSRGWHQSAVRSTLRRGRSSGRRGRRCSGAG